MQGFWLLKKVSDFEAITYDKEKDEYYAITSHRNLDKESESILVKFKIQENWSDYREKIKGAKVVDLVDKLREHIMEESILSDEEIGNWYEKSKDEAKLNRFSLEIEALEYYSGHLLIGLKYPLKEGKAIILKYNLFEGEFEEAVYLDLNDKGITAFHRDKEKLYIAASPTGKPRVGTLKKDEGFLYDSKLYVSKLSDLSNVSLLGGYAQITTGKLEAIAGDNKGLALFYEGGEPTFSEIPWSSLKN